MSTTKFKIDSFWLKIIALVCMIIDHVGHYFIPVESELYIPLRLIGRIAFPIFCFTLVEGFKYTSDRGKYGLRLGIVTVIMAVGNVLLGMEPFAPNIMATFFLMFLVLLCINREGPYFSQDGDVSPILISLLGGFLCFVVCKWLDYGAYAVITILCFHLARNRKLGIVLFVIGNILLCIYNKNVLQGGMILAAPILWFYTDEYPKYKMKWLFYIFYPAHVWLFTILSKAIIK